MHYIINYYNINNAKFEYLQKVNAFKPGIISTKIHCIHP